MRAPRAFHPVTEEAQARVLALLEPRFGPPPWPRDLLIECLHGLQDGVGYLAGGHLAALAPLLKLSAVEVFEVASFYHHFDVVRSGESPPAPLTVRVCDSVSCELAGAGELLAALRAACGPEVRVQAVPCVGRCEAAPVAVVGWHPVEHASVSAVAEALAAGRLDCPVPAAVRFDDYRAGGGYGLFDACLRGERSAEDLIAILEASGLRGLGGAGFPAGRKWKIVRGMAAPRYLAVNIDEGEPGTFKDRHYLERDPHRLIEGALIAAWAVGCARIWLYLRDEYAGVQQLLEEELPRVARHYPDAPPMALRRGAGAYICGEESAMIESIEGKRGQPRLRPPYVAEVGLFGRPTLEHNMETLWWVRDLVHYADTQGSDWFAAQGRRGRKGLRSFSVSGRVMEPGVKLAPAGISLRELIDEHCGGMAPGHELYAWFPGGASGGILPASLADVPLDFDTLAEYGCFIGSAAVIVLSQADRARDAALNAMRFFAHESCGKCTPCRNGTARAAALMAERTWNVPLLEELASTMADASICGLGQAAPNPLKSVIRFFPHELGSDA